MRIYVASSWRNKHQQMVVAALRQAGHNVYDFRNPRDGQSGFQWSEIDPAWQDWKPEEYREALNHPIAQQGYNSDFDAMNVAHACVLVLPCNRSAHTEAGWMAGMGRKTFVLMLTKEEPELMYKVFDKVCLSIDELIKELVE